jgi:endonuclease YncB( thermonuclease family)
MLSIRTAAALLMGLAVGAPAGALAADVVTGPAHAVDADILLVGKQRVILWEVDAPERPQQCFVGALKWGCYDAARQALDDLVAAGETTCTLTDEPADKFHRRYGVCTNSGKDVGAELVRQGMAWAYLDQGSDYVPEQDEARAAQIGVFQPGARIDVPWEWRKRDPRNYR